MILFIPTLLLADNDEDAHHILKPPERQNNSLMYYFKFLFKIKIEKTNKRKILLHLVIQRGENEN